MKPSLSMSAVVSVCLLAGRQEVPLSAIELIPEMTLGVKANQSFLNAQDVAVCSDGCIIVSDKLDYKLKKFDKNGRLVGEIGRRGTGPGEFRGPASVALHHDAIAVSDFATNRIQLFSNTLQYRSTILTPGAVQDLQFDSDGALWVAILQDHPTANVVKMGMDGKIQLSIQLRNATVDPFDNMIFLRITRNNEVVVVYGYQNKIEIWSTGGTLVSEFEVRGFPLRPKKKRISTELFEDGLTVPADNIFLGAAVDTNAGIFVLAGEYSVSPRRDIFRLDRKGNLISLAVTPGPCSAIEIGPDNRVYCIEKERTLVTKYRMER